MHRLIQTTTINDTNRDFVLSIFYGCCDQQTADETIEKVKKMTPDEIFQKTRWLFDTGDQMPAFNTAFRYRHGVLYIDNIRVIVSITDGEDWTLAGGLQHEHA